MQSYFLPAVKSLICLITDTFDVDVGDVSKRLALRNKLNCKSFRWYLKHIYPEFVSYEGDYFSGQVGFNNLWT